MICDISGIKKIFFRRLRGFAQKVLEPFFPGMIGDISGIRKNYSRRLHGFAWKTPAINSAVSCDINGIL